MALASCSTKQDEAQLLASELRSVNKLVLARMDITKMASIADWDIDQARGARQMVAAIADKMKIGARRAAYSYDTYLQAYVDLSRLVPGDVVVDETAKTITLNLPQIETEFAGRDATFTEQHYRVTGLRSDVNAAERAKIKERMNAALLDEVEKDPRFRDMVVESARAKGIDFFSTLAARPGYAVIVNLK